MATRDFDSKDIKKNSLNYKLNGFDPSKHSCGATVSNNQLVTYAVMDGKRYEDVISNVGLSSSDVSCKGRKNMVEVNISKSGYNIRDKI